MRVYLAGPDIFRPELEAWSAAVRARLAAHGHQALIPIDGTDVTANGIYQANLAMICSADAVLANLNPFRGHEPDSGTCFEVGYAIAQGKPVVGYLSDGRAQKDRLGQSGRTPAVDSEGLLIEDFDRPVNLMLAIPCRLVVGDLYAAVAELSNLDLWSTGVPCHALPPTP